MTEDAVAQQLPDNAADGADAGISAPGAPARARAEPFSAPISHTTGDGRLMIGTDIELLHQQEVPALASPGTRAFEARDRRLGGEQFVLLCETGCVPRLAQVGAYLKLRDKSALRLIEAGIVDWLPERRQRFALVFEKPGGRKLLETPDGKPPPFNEDRLIDAIIKPAIEVLSVLTNNEAVHGAINAQNVYLVGPPGQEVLVLGECLSSAPSFWQHPLYEVAPRAMAKGAGRGKGTSKDDLYALGVCVAMLARGENILAGRTPQQVIQEKIELGSYGMIIGRARIPGAVAEFLRGVLNDDEAQRWDIDDAQLWIEGRRHQAKQPSAVMKAARGLVFLNEKYMELRPLAAAFSANVAAAAAEIEKGEFDTWLKRNFTDKTLKIHVDAARDRDRNTTPERLVCGICTALDPYAPVRFKGQALFPVGLGPALAEAVTRGDDLQVFGELVTQQQLGNWISRRFDEIPNASDMMSRLEKCRMAVTQRTPGYGMERALYILNPELPCLSPAFRDMFIVTPGSLLSGLERAVQQGQGPSTILDRHMIAFISVREPRLIDPHLGYFNAPEKSQQFVSALRTLAGIQRKFGVGPLPALCDWMISMAAPAVEVIHNRDLRQDMTRQLNRLSGSGNLWALLELLDDQLLVQDDLLRFDMARREFRALVREKIEIDNSLKKRRGFGRATGRQVSMILSCTVAVVVIMIYIVVSMMRLF